MSVEGITDAIIRTAWISEAIIPYLNAFYLLLMVISVFLFASDHKSPRRRRLAIAIGLTSVAFGIYSRFFR